ncbi:glycosyltransferase family 2 protein [Lysinibacillus louembei]|uniref:Glycosyltransferase family 2 protein n=1 Tax=Lysinibacillus louembei TaxID=1470088 RepID=A0ABZ0RYJ5_9BACI|nr:glycosyltransferase family 2 protein [Lysinibacillus louembei]WPK12479.1 glycosyltransferase family 2 protein [Lysinibacillus louembei]
MQISIDIIVVIYNSERWIGDFLNSLKKQHYPLEKIHITFVDNNSKDKSYDLLNSCIFKEKFGDYTILKQEKNIGFGAANNIAASKTNQSHIYFLNIDTELHQDTLINIVNQALIDEGIVGAWESRQFPYEHPKHYNPVTLEVSWSSAAALLVRRECFQKIGGFDEEIFMYGEDVDLSWRIRAAGYRIHYVPQSIIYHYTFEKSKVNKDNELLNIIGSNLFLRYRYGSFKDIILGYVMCLLWAIKHRNFKFHLKLSQILIKSFSKMFKRKPNNLVANFCGWNYEIHRLGHEFHNSLLLETPLVSIIVRTNQRPEMLREALTTIKNQTYQNIEIIVVEDGFPKSKKLVEKSFKNLNIKYHATIEKVGRTKLANIGLALATGEYFNFLDDDDLLYADHIEVLVTSLINNPSYKIAYSIAFETPTKLVSMNPYIYEEIHYSIEFNSKFDRQLLLTQNYFPIQTVLFAREVYDKLGGMDESMEVLEDWDYWLKLSTQYDFLYIEKITSIYKVPFQKTDALTRKQELIEQTEYIREKYATNNINIPSRQSNFKKKVISNFKINQCEVSKILKFKIKQKY